MVRLPDWPRLLSDYLKERAAMPFAWGSNDCMAFTAKGVEAITGVDYFTEYSDYDSEQSGKHLLELNGGVAGIIGNCLGKGSPSILQANRGDVVIVKLPELTAGLVDDSGQRIAVVTPEGLIRLPLGKAWRVWSV